MRSTVARFVFVSAASPEFRPDIEGLRALAVAGVVAFHFGLTALPGGFAGVDIFFVISGYLITRHLTSEISLTGRLDFLRFYARRARRLLPAALFVIAATLAAGAVILSPEEQALYSKGAMFASAYMINLWLIRWSFDYFANDAANNPFIHYWSLSVEEQFYLAWPALLMLAAWLKPGKRTIMLAIGVAGLASFAVCAWLTPISQPWAFYFSPLRAWEFAAGGLASMAPAWLLDKRPRLGAAFSLAGLAMIAFAYLTFSEEAPFPGFLALVPVAGTVLLLLAGAAGARSGPTALLALPPLQWTGKLSYSLYLWHWPVIVYAGMLVEELTFAQRLACLGLTLALSALTYHLIENPIRRNGWLMANAARALVPALLLTGTGVAAAYGNAALAVRDLDPEQRTIAASAAEPATARAKACVEGYDSVAPSPCVFGTGQRAIALFGDSHADHWSTPLVEAAKKNGYRVETWLKSSCRASRYSFFVAKLNRDYRECDQWREQAIKEIIAAKPSLVVISELALTSSRKMAAGKGEPDTSDAAWRAGLRSTLVSLSNAGLKIAFIRDVPFNDENVDTCVARALWRNKTPSLCDQTRSYAANDAMAAVEREIVDSVPNASYVDLTDRFCNTTTCHVFIDGKLAFRDQHHLATPFAESLEPEVEKRVISKVGR
ncbi:acyltransferase [Mesorhizobium sp. M1C.F.Ca.ET.193.01.1.1]|uniref:acyltransferase family protein n=4 Tax=Mesorhizobium TaxID=68287 RepID=UPI000FD24A18|nr:MULTISPECIES: acyltransferase family protein [unclassified Mesorhizobium]TGS97382.1 acyltransferase [bacterium M00.F.Ca.ET.177.01.1.1]TGQ52552.1 acyltransferase [Mesorhizobium sp. M1C.F.Ca.ET.210.01.1.1]TGQ69175.1 acyltransferase [Mesorhizobium sp. M1C.F.Ca.ET.212.01.1.1]TGR05190.1 acyltransferase [Mesorhizobium sp. M1C.F.Ca.ET.204.01.1.1]TGR25795.1 acyltransferase [Mesorhizobium sp. M1C.F.Ca.ET.196.01.1.1]